MILEILLVIFALLCFWLWNTSRKWNHWSAQGIYQLPNQFPFGSSFLCWDTALGRVNMGDIALSQYQVKASVATSSNSS